MPKNLFINQRRLIILISFSLWIMPLFTGLLSFLLTDIDIYGYTTHINNTLSAQDQPLPKKAWDAMRKDDDEKKSAQSIIERYDRLFTYLQGEGKTNYDSISQLSFAEWDALNKPDQEIFQPDSSLGNHLGKSVVFGWHPYWMGNTYKSYNYNLLTHVSFYGYVVDPATGYAANDSTLQYWQQSDFVEIIKEAKGPRALLTLINYGASNIKYFLDNEENQFNQLFLSLDTLLKETGAHGIDLNFEGIPKDYGNKFNIFVTELSNFIRREKYLLTLTVSLADVENLPIKELNTKVDFMVLMGYGFQPKNNARPGPVAPLYSGSYNLNSAVRAYLATGILPDDLVLGLPYFGAQWKSLVNGRKTFDKYLTYRQIKSTYRDFSSTYSAPDSLTVSKSGILDQEEFIVHYDDDVTLRKKMAYAREKGLRGIGIWALGYDNGHIELWEAIHDEFSKERKFSSVRPESLAAKISAFIIKYQKLLVTAFIFIVCFLVFGFMAALNYSSVRQALFANNTYRTLIVFSIFTGLVLLYWIFNFHEIGPAPGQDNILVLIFGLVIGYAATHTVYHYYQKWKNSLPD
jgi:spore germination protein YaaH